MVQHPIYAIFIGNNTSIMTGSNIRIIPLQDNRVESGRSPGINRIQLYASTAHIGTCKALGPTDNNFVRAIHTIATTTNGSKQIVVVTTLMDICRLKGFPSNLGLLA